MTTANKKRGNALLLRNLTLALVVVVLVALVLIPQLRLAAPEGDPVPQFERRDGYIFLPESSPIRDRIVVEEAQTEVLRREVSAPASVEANPSKRGNIFPPAGGRIVRLFVNMGQQVRAGQPLFELYSPEIAEIQTEFISARSALAQAERDLRRREDLHARGIAAERELEEARTEYEIALSEMEGASLKIQIMGIEVESIGKPLIVRAPINGRVVHLDVAPGEFIAEPDEPLMIVADLSSVWVTANIQEKDIRLVSPGDDVYARFAAYPGEVHEGKVLFISDILDQETRTTRVVVEFENEDNKLKPGMFATVNFLSQPVDEVVLPARAVLQRRDYNYVYVETAPHTFEMRKVVAGDRAGDKLVITRGIYAGERVVTVNAVMLP